MRTVMPGAQASARWRAFACGLVFLAVCMLAASTSAWVPHLSMLLSAELTPVPDIEGNLGPAGFGHLMSGYDAGYYGYLWSKVYAQDLYTRFAKDGPMNPRTGRAYRDLVVSPAATQEPDTALKRFLGRPLSYDAFFAEMGIGGAGNGKPTP